MMLTGLASVLRAAGLKVVEQSGWKQRGHGGMTDVRGITIHHTAGGRSLRPRRSLNTVQNGRPGLDGPLAQLYVDTDGTWYVVAAGLAYHAGVSLTPTMTNSHRIGIEAEAAGDGWSQDWPDVQLRSLAIGTAALRHHYGCQVRDVLGHKETCSPPGRKIDPSFSMTWFRQRVANPPSTAEVPAPQPKPTPLPDPPPPPKEILDMQLSDRVPLTAAAARGLNLANPVPEGTAPRFVAFDPEKPDQAGSFVTVAFLLLWGSITSQQADFTLDRDEPPVEPTP